MQYVLPKCKCKCKCKCVIPMYNNRYRQSILTVDKYYTYILVLKIGPSISHEFTNFLCPK